MDQNIYKPTRLTDKDFRRLSEFIHAETGIMMPPGKKTMLESRLEKRLRALDLTSFAQYCDYLFSKEGMQEEQVPMIDLVTTNKTDFFREPDHFALLTEKALPTLVAESGAGIREQLLVWSAACSSGEEPYTLSIVLSEFAEKCPGFRFSILATDISRRILEKAKLAVYDQEKVDPVPENLKRKYLLRGKENKKGMVKIVPELRALVEFKRLNLMENVYDISRNIHAIFCRNVMIYFEREVQEELLFKLCHHLIPGGYLFTGHAETLRGTTLPLIPVAPAVYRKQT